MRVVRTLVSTSAWSPVGRFGACQREPPATLLDTFWSSVRASTDGPVHELAKATRAERVTMATPNVYWWWVLWAMREAEAADDLTRQEFLQLLLLRLSEACRLQAFSWLASVGDLGPAHWLALMHTDPLQRDFPHQLMDLLEMWIIAGVVPNDASLRHTVHLFSLDVSQMMDYVLRMYTLRAE